MNVEATFCMESGQIRCGDDDKDTFVKMLQQVTRVTPSMAGGIASVYPSVDALVHAFEKEGSLILEDVMVSRTLFPMVWMLTKGSERAQQGWIAIRGASWTRNQQALTQDFHEQRTGEYRGLNASERQ